MSTRIQNPELRNTHDGLVKKINSIQLQIKQTIKKTLTNIELPDLETMSKIGEFAFLRDENGQLRGGEYYKNLLEEELLWLDEFRVGINLLDTPHNRKTGGYDFGEDVLLCHICSPEELYELHKKGFYEIGRDSSLISHRCRYPIKGEILEIQKGIFSDINGDLITIPLNRRPSNYSYDFPFKIDYLRTYIGEDGQMHPEHSYLYFDSLNEHDLIHYYPQIIESLDELMTNGTNPAMAETILQKLIQEKEAKEEREKRAKRKERREYKKQIKDEYRRLFGGNRA